MKKMHFNFAADDGDKKLVVSSEITQLRMAVDGVTSYQVAMKVDSPEMTRTVRKTFDEIRVMEQPLEVILFVYTHFPELNLLEIESKD